MRNVRRIYVGKTGSPASLFVLGILMLGASVWLVYATTTASWATPLVPYSYILAFVCVATAVQVFALGMGERCSRDEALSAARDAWAREGSVLWIGASVVEIRSPSSRLVLLGPREESFLRRIEGALGIDAISPVLVRRFIRSRAPMGVAAHLLLMLALPVFANPMAVPSDEELTETYVEADWYRRSCSEPVATLPTGAPVRFRPKNTSWCDVRPDPSLRTKLVLSGDTNPPRVVAVEDAERSYINLVAAGRHHARQLLIASSVLGVASFLLMWVWTARSRKQGIIRKS